MLAVYLKELKEMVRDRKTLFITVATPLIVIMFMISIISFSTNELTTSIVNNITIGVEDTNSDFAQLLAAADGIKVVESKEPLKDMRAGSIGAYLEAPDNMTELMRSDEEIPVEITYNNGLLESQAAVSVLSEFINTLNDTYLTNKLDENGLPHTYAAKYSTELNNVEVKTNGSIMLTMFPMLLITYCLFGVSAIANDLGTGEKERGTLESLLATGVKRNSIMAGKYLAICTSGILCAASSLLGFVFSSGLNPMLSLDISFTDGLIILFLALLVASAFAGLCFALSIFAKTNREAQMYSTIITSISILPSITMSSVDVARLSAADFIAPLYNVVYCLKEILQHSINPVHILITAISMAVCVGLCFFLTKVMFNNERFLFRK